MLRVFHIKSLCCLNLITNSYIGRMVRASLFHAVDTLIFCAKANRNAQIHMIQDGQKKEEVKNVEKTF